MITLKQTKIWCEKGNTSVQPVASLRPNYKLESDHNFGEKVI
jgi:hypothetical protein